MNNAVIEVEEIVDGLGLGHSIMICKRKMYKILELIPQRPPIVMVDEFLGLEDNISRTCFTVRKNNIFVDNDFSECGLI